MPVKPDLRDAFDRVVVINLARRSERLARFNQLFESWPFKSPQRFDAIDGSQIEVPEYWKNGPGAWGCMLSHRAILARAIEDRISTLFVLEDDAYPIPGFAGFAAGFLAKVPDDWDCLMFGAEHINPPEIVGPGIIRCMGSNRTHAFALRGRMIPILLAYLEHHTTEHCDIVLASLMPYMNVYAPNPFLIGQDAGESDVTGVSEQLRFLSAWQMEEINARRRVAFPERTSNLSSSRAH
jgi:hypothetical protein